MDTGHKIEISSTYDKCKYTVKQWENNFKKTKGRTPSKLDIKEASQEVWHAYKTYFKLKIAALEESLTNIDGFEVDEEIFKDTANDKEKCLDDDVINHKEKCLDDDVINHKEKCLTEDVELSEKVNSESTWGSHLNHSEKNKKVETKSENSNVNLSFTNKLFQGLKSSKRLPRKTLSFNRKKSDVGSSKPKFLSQPDPSCSLSQELDVSCLTQNSGVSFNDSDMKIASSKFFVSQPINILQNTFKANPQENPLRVIDQGWIDRIEKSICDIASPQEVKVLKNSNNHCNENSNSKFFDNNVSISNCDSDNIIDNSDEEDISKLYHITKKRRISSINSNIKESQLNDSSPNLITVDIATKRLDFSNVFCNKSETSTGNPKVNDSCESQTIGLKERQKSDDLQTRPKRIKIARRASGKIKITNCDAIIKDFDETDANFVLEQKDTEKTIPESAKRKLRQRNSAKNKSIVSDGKKNKQTGNNNYITSESTSQKSYELEYSVKPRITTVPRISNIKQAICKEKRQSPIDKKTEITAELPETSHSQVDPKLPGTGIISDNFIQINLKKKVYVRGKKKQSFTNYKKQQWKNKKLNSEKKGCEGGTLKCFNCGREGHFARACNYSVSDQLRPLEDDTEECAVPTLEEAAQMARESALTIRKPNANHVINDNETNSESDVAFEDVDDTELLAEVERLEEEIAKIDVQKYVDTTKHIKPYYNLSENDVIIDTPQEVFTALNLFGHESFRVGQEQAIMRILSGQSTLLTLSTGSGKSLCYQLPAYLYSKREPCLSLIISPLVSLMEDQVTGIPFFLRAACLHTNQTKTQRDKVMDAIKAGSLSILLVSPEAVVSGEKSSGFGSLLRQLPPIAFACIDEVHCVSHWSHNFRPSYLKICKVLKDRLGVNTILGLTATATRTTCDSIIQHLGIPDGRNGHISDIPLPTNLNLTTSKDTRRNEALLGLLLSEPFKSYKSIIIYCTRREECQRVAIFLRTFLKNENETKPNGKQRKTYSSQAEFYHAGMAAYRRKSIQKLFMSGELRIVVATVAFGMGINKADIRSVIHYNMPMSFENYVQEMGRAGRDGLPAHCHLFLDAQGNDENELRRHIYANSTDRRTIRNLIGKCFLPCSCKSTCPRHEVAFSIEETVQALDISEEIIETLLCYLELHDKHYIEILSHAYTSCKIISYGGPNEINKASKECAPLAMALALYKTKDDKPSNIFEFPVIEVASAMGWDSGICKHILKNLEWVNVRNKPERSKLSVEFSNLGFRLLSPGNLKDTDLDEALDSLCKRVSEQEQMSLTQLHTVHETLTSVTFPSFDKCLKESESSGKQQLLKTKIREYFESPKPLDLVSKINSAPLNEEQVKSDVRSLVNTYRDNSFSGRAVARIFHGIQSPNYPAFIWGRCKFWRSYLGTDFNAICQIAAQEIQRLK